LTMKLQISNPPQPAPGARHKNPRPALCPGGDSCFVFPLPGACSHSLDGWRCERKPGQTRPSPRAVATPPPRARTQYGPICAATRRDGASFPHLCVAPRFSNQLQRTRRFLN
jgi:hypothetical protein